MTKEEILARISWLEDEIYANDQANQMMQDEIDQLYEEIDDE